MTLVYIFIRTAGQVCVYKTIEVPIYVYKRHTYMHTYMRDTYTAHMNVLVYEEERWGSGVETQKNVRGEIGGWGRVPFNEPYAPSLSTIYDGA